MVVSHGVSRVALLGATADPPLGAWAKLPEGATFGCPGVQGQDTTPLYENCPKAVMTMYLAPRVLGVYLLESFDHGAQAPWASPALAVPPRSTNIPLREMYQVSIVHLL